MQNRNGCHYNEKSVINVLLLEHVFFRVKKLKDTLTAVQQLEQDMSNLREWLSRVERELNTPLTYETCHMLEIETKQKFHEVSLMIEAWFFFVEMIYLCSIY